MPIESIEIRNYRLFRSAVFAELPRSMSSASSRSH
jgi:hypothetical protein